MRSRSGSQKHAMAIPFISIVIPTKNSGRTLEACLKSIRAQRYPAYEVIIVDALSSDDTLEIASRYAHRTVSSDAPLAKSRNVGFSYAKGGILLSVDSDMVLEAGLLEDIASRMDGHGALIIPELGYGRSFLSHLKSLEKRCYLGDPSMESARAFTRKAFDAAGGYDESLVFGEDRDIHCRIAASFSIWRTKRRFYHDTDSLSFGSDIRKFYRYGGSARSYISKKNPGAKTLLSPSRFLFLGHGRTLAKSPIESLWLIGLKGAESAAFGLGYLLAGRGR